MSVCLFFMHLVPVRASVTKLSMAYHHVRGKAKTESARPKVGWESPLFSKILESLIRFLQYSSRALKSARSLWIKNHFSTQNVLPSRYLVIHLLQRYNNWLIQKVRTWYCFLSNLRTGGNKNQRFSSLK
jgi:hypothetical protein